MISHQHTTGWIASGRTTSAPDRGSGVPTALREFLNDVLICLLLVQPRPPAALATCATAGGSSYATALFAPEIFCTIGHLRCLNLLCLHELSYVMTHHRYQDNSDLRWGVVYQHNANVSEMRVAKIDQR